MFYQDVGLFCMVLKEHYKEHIFAYDCPNERVTRFKAYAEANKALLSIVNGQLSESQFDNVKRLLDMYENDIWHEIAKYDAIPESECAGDLDEEN